MSRLLDRNDSTRPPLRSSDIDNGALVERLVRLRRAHQTLAHELAATQRRLFEREREIRSLRAALETPPS